MAITCMIWNVQNFGQGTAYYDSLKGANSSRLAQFIARLAQRNQLSILFLLEVMPANPQAHLDSVLLALNAVASGGANDWMYDYIKGSVAQNNPATPVNAPGDLTWQSGIVAPRQEGYAVFWRNGHADFDMMRAASGMSEGARRQVGYAPAYQPPNVVSLSLRGRDVVARGGRRIRLRPSANFNPGVALGGFATSYYPEVSGILGGGSLYYSYVRRPAYVLIRRTGGAPQNASVIPIVAYHAPSKPLLASLGTFISGMAGELYTVRTIDGNSQPTGAWIHPLNFVAAGDFNRTPSTADIWNDTYGPYHNAYANNLPTGQPFGGANGTAVYDDTGVISTTVQLNQYQFGLFNGPPIASALTTAYEFSGLDNMFRRGVAPIGGLFQIADMLPEVMGANPDIVAGIQAYAPAMNALNLANGGANAVTGPVTLGGAPMFNFFTNWAGFLVDMNAGSFTTARSAAEFYRMFVSDHLPVMIRF